MTHWDHDIHRVQEIQQLLESRQRYFRGHLNSLNKLDSDGNPLYFPKLNTSRKSYSTSSINPSQRHSVGATFGSIGSGSESARLHSWYEEREDSDSSNMTDYSDGNSADLSQNESSDASGNNEKVGLKKKVKKTPRKLRKCVNKNLAIALSPASTRKVSSDLLNIGDSRKSSILRFKSVSFDNQDGSPNGYTEKGADDLVTSARAIAQVRRRETPDPASLLMQRSWILKAELASRLKTDVNSLNFEEIIPKMTKKTIDQARDKLRKAERSLRATEKNTDQRIPSFKIPNLVGDDTKRKISFSSKAMNPQPVSVSRLAQKRQEDLLKSDLNLREAFALIKVDPEPLLNLRSVEPNKNPSRESGISLSTGKVVYVQPMQRNSEIDSKTSQSLRRLTNQSIQQMRRRESQIPNTPMPAYQKLPDNMDRLMHSARKNMSSVGPSEKRKNSFTSSGLNRTGQTKDSLFSQRMGNAIDRRGSKTSTDEKKSYNILTIDKLIGTVI